MRYAKAATTRGGSMDAFVGYELTWHEDDELHQAEGMLSARLGISIDEAVAAIERRAKASRLPVHDAASNMLDEARAAVLN
ncbi:ANTAR domain-containing protein [Actinomycetospora sp. CA-053990]|uniref:ANTAR domain-containing protein n=1 Tax=Actinomycetospora sp. CA-053990 TaxID=3239891 RepID=UPI003D8CCFA5